MFRRPSASITGEEKFSVPLAPHEDEVYGDYGVYQLDPEANTSTTGVSEMLTNYEQAGSHARSKCKPDSSPIDQLRILSNTLQ